jgi:nucleotide-binding universal stress UspA family protein
MSGRDPVVVGTDGSVEGQAALMRGAWEANRAGLPLRLVHAYVASVPYPALGLTAYPVEVTYPRDEAQKMLTLAAEQVGDMYPSLSIDTDLIAGSPGGVLVDESRHASLLVVGSRGYGGFEGLLLGSVTAALAAHSRAPLIVVRPGGDESTGRPPGGPVVVGVDGLPESTPVLRFGFEQAAARGVPLIAVYVWWLLPPTNLGPTSMRHYDEAEAAEEARRMLAEALAGWSDEYPQVSIWARPTHDLNPLLALLDASAEAGLAVVGRHGGNTVNRLVLGSIGDALVRRATCAVAVVPSE